MSRRIVSRVSGTAKPKRQNNLKDRHAPPHEVSDDTGCALPGYTARIKWTLRMLMCASASAPLKSKWRVGSKGACGNTTFISSSR